MGEKQVDLFFLSFILILNQLFNRSKKRESVPDLAPLLWNSFGTIAALLQEIINIYPAINPATLTAHQSNRVCNALALLQVRGARVSGDWLRRPAHFEDDDFDDFKCCTLDFYVDSEHFTTFFFLCVWIELTHWSQFI